MNAMDTIAELLDELGCEEITFTRAAMDGGPPVPAVRCRQAIVGREGFPPTMILHQPIYPSYVECLSEVLERARIAHQRLASKKKAAPDSNNVVALK